MRDEDKIRTAEDMERQVLALGFLPFFDVGFPVSLSKSVRRGSIGSRMKKKDRGNGKVLSSAKGIARMASCTIKSGLCQS